MDALLLARWQFAITTIYHFFFVPLSIGLALIVAIMETIYVRTGNPLYKTMTKFWGKLLVINFAIGVATGIVQEFQFGMNWSDYSRFVGDIFGAPLAIEALMAFFLESTFLGLWLFGWEKLTKRQHLASIWLLAIGSALSSFWILAANSFMHQPVGYVINNGRAEMESFTALLTNGHLWVQWPHTMFASIATAAFFVLGISAYHLRRPLGAEAKEIFLRSFQIGTFAAVIGSLGVAMAGHAQSQYLIEVQPMKMAAAEALWESEDPAALSLFTVASEAEQRDLFAIKIPGMLSFLAYNRFEGEVRGIKELQAEAEALYGPGDYTPSVFLNYWAFRGMVGAGTVMLGLAAMALYMLAREKVVQSPRLLLLLIPALLLPYLANATGWIFTEIGRQPWIVYGVLRTEDAVSPTVSAGMVLTTLIGFTLIYLVLMGATAYLMFKYATRVPGESATVHAG
ncbi:cytochrome bd ubiquinol oxidase subunit I [Oscillochloris trichoides DG-6]|uniref:Cytochrome bd ubiquinol oxidase subunit I n=1 Tax=Oscillochloris trichoides DG-6 TaxID=765420 RepID=E1IED9_9CHLR|nr:cytochrome ubiquinol oxidase subunit I [Oscillochloris trichoides]EFO80465.1 cytochrome bd ubiquinol oxidase subunit I [Oscillochloris trichoides DG-6]